MVGNFCFGVNGELSAQDMQFFKPCGGVTHNCGDADHLGLLSRGVELTRSQKSSLGAVASPKPYRSEFQEAIKLDPSFAAAHVVLDRCTSVPAGRKRQSRRPNPCSPAHDGIDGVGRRSDAASLPVSQTTPLLMLADDHVRAAE
jgi:hypothetical protein